MSLYLKEMRITGLNTLLSKRSSIDTNTAYKISFKKITEFFLFEDYDEADKFLDWFRIDTQSLLEDDDFDR